MEYTQFDASVPPEKINDYYYVLNTQIDTDLDNLKTSLGNDDRVIRVQNVFINEYGGKVIFSNNVIINRSSYISSNQYDSLLAHYGVVETGFDPTKESVRYLRANDETELTILEIANRMYESDGIIFSHPSFKGNFERFYTPSDPHFSWQWNFKNTEIYDTSGYADYMQGRDIRVEKAWDITKGDPNVIVAVIDDAIGNHPDFRPGALIDTFDVIDGDVNCIMADCDTIAHGFACAGLIIADHNEIGVAGLVPECKLIFIKVAHDNGNYGNFDIMAQAMREAAQRGANIISCSWGCTFCAPADVLNDAIKDVTDPTRMGYSCSVFFASGNMGWYPVAYPAKLAEVIAVGATDSIDGRWDYSSSGDSLDVVATSGNVPRFKENDPYNQILQGSILTIDRPGAFGYNPHRYQFPYYAHCEEFGGQQPQIENIGEDYFCSFGGTSAACPQVAGIAAMVMSRRQDLIDSNYTIYNIIKQSAEDTVGIGSSALLDTPGWDAYYGWGRVNALRALQSVTRGDLIDYGVIDIIDITYLINYRYKGGPPPVLGVALADTNCDGTIDILDTVDLINFVYKGGAAPPFCYIYDYPELE
ncbi:MAG: S8 family serine peptidase [candidate division Zixibacteria bacterium]|nr:S8 family serine peptidase [candidate division Zixibacteria bacterium]